MTKVTIAKAAAAMNKGPQFVRIALQRGLVPFGFAVKLQDEEGTRYDYYINPKMFCQYLGITEQELENVGRTEKKVKGNIILPEPLF